MAFTDRRPTEHRLPKLIAVDAFQSALAYGLVSGLVVAVKLQEDTKLQATDYRVAPFPLPPEEVDPPITKPVVEPKPPLTTDVPDLTGFAPAGMTISFDGVEPPGLPSRPRVTPLSTPKLASPRNDPRLWVTTSDYPARDIREGNKGTTRFQLSIDSDGKLQTCRILSSSGHPSLDEAACTNIMRRARFDPARDGAGEKVFGTYSSTVRWVIPRD
jgi:protein TonB